MKRLAALGAVALMFGWLPILPARAAGGGGSAVFAAEAEAWAYSIEVGIPGPLGPLASHTTAAVDNSPHATGAAGLADPGYLVRAAAGLVAGVPTPAYCESAWPEGPGHSDCGASAAGHNAAQSTTDSAAGPNATATATLGQVTPSDAAGAFTIAAQSTTSAALLDADGTLRARADATLQGVSIAGGAVRLGTLIVHREATAGGANPPSTSSSIELSGVTVAGTPVAPGADPMKSLTDEARGVFGDTLTFEALGERIGQPNKDALTADSSGLRIIWRPQPDRSVQIVLGYGRVLVYRSGIGGATVGGLTPIGGAATPGDTDAQVVDGAPAAVLAPPSADAPAPEVPVQSIPRLLTLPASTPVRWVSPFLVLAQMTSGIQVWWFVLALAPLAAGAWLTRHSGMGVIAPWLARGRERSS